MSLEFALQKYPRQIALRDASSCELRPLRKQDETRFHKFFLAVPEKERMMIKHRVSDPAVISEWCRNIDLGRNFPLLMLMVLTGEGGDHFEIGDSEQRIGRGLNPDHLRSRSERARQRLRIGHVNETEFQIGRPFSDPFKQPETAAIQVIAGDFNVIPAPEDVYNPSAWTEDALFRPETRAQFQALVNLGLTDAFRACHDEPNCFTFWDYQAGAWQKNQGLRIDHLLLSPQAADRLQVCEIDPAPRLLCGLDVRHAIESVRHCQSRKRKQGAGEMNRIRLFRQNHSR